MSESPAPLTHLAGDGLPRMVDVADKPLTRRAAVAEACVRVSPALAEAIANDRLQKGSVFAVARLAGIQAAKRTAELIPLCHALPLDHVEVDLALDSCRVSIRAVASTTWKTGVEMEALTAAAVAALTVIDMGKSIDRAISIEHVRLVSKTGGRSGDYAAAGAQP